MDPIVKAEVKLSGQQVKHYEALLLIGQRRSTNDGTRIKNWVYAGICVLVTLFFAGVIVSDVIANRMGFIDVTYLLLICSVILTGISMRHRLKSKGHDGKAHKENKREATEFTILFFSEMFKVGSKEPEEYKNRDYPYDRYVNAIEWQDAFFLHAGNNKELIIPKCCITEGTSEGLTQLLSVKLGNRFMKEEGKS